MSRSAYGFCHGLCGAVRISCTPSDWIRSRTSALYLLSRSRMRYMRSLSVGECFYDLLCRPSPGRMLGHIEMQHLSTIVFQDNQYNSILLVIVGTVKKSIDTIWPTWLCRKVLQVW